MTELPREDTEITTAVQEIASSASQPAHFVYILQCANGTLYTGYTTNVQRRVSAHNAGKGARYTRAHLPVQLLASWSFLTKNEALRTEYAIKQLSRSQKQRLIEQTRQTEHATCDQARALLHTFINNHRSPIHQTE